MYEYTYMYLALRLFPAFGLSFKLNDDFRCPNGKKSLIFRCRSLMSFQEKVLYSFPAGMVRQELLLLTSTAVVTITTQYVRTQPVETAIVSVTQTL